MSQEISPGIFFLLFSAYFQSNYVAEASHQQNNWLAHSNNFVLKYFLLKCNSLVVRAYLQISNCRNNLRKYNIYVENIFTVADDLNMIINILQDGLQCVVASHCCIHWNGSGGDHRQHPCLCCHIKVGDL